MRASYSFRAAPIEEVFDMLSQKDRVNIILSRGVTGTVTLNLYDVTVKEAINTNSKLMVAIIAALKDAGIAENDIQTTRFSIQPIYTDSRAEPKLSGYNVSNHVNVTIRGIGKVGELLDRAVAAGATDVGNLSFLISDASKALDQAREAAIADARRKAVVYAKASAVRLGRVEWISADTGGGPPVLANKLREAPAPIASGEDTVRVRVTVGFQIAR